MTAIARTQAGRPMLGGPGIFSLAAGGVAFAVLLLIVGYQSGQFLVASGDVMMFERVGAALRSGGAVYAEQGDQGIAATFFYAPPWAVVFAVAGLLPAAALHALIALADLLALRVVAGSWRGAALCCWFPLYRSSSPTGTST